MRPDSKGFFIMRLLFSCVSGLFGICFIRALILFPEPESPVPCDDTVNHKPITVDHGIVQRFSDALKFKTISTTYHTYDRDELTRFRLFLEKSFPVIHASPLVDRKIIANYSLLYEIKGSDPSLKPYMLCAHLDVVPVEKEKWSVDPFAGVVKNGFIYGRGAVDVKDVLMGIMEAVEFELSQGFKPKRSFYLAFGHDEEVMGLDGAVAINDYLLSKDVELEFLLDEGTVILKNSIHGVPKEKIAIIGVAEKGYLTVELKVEGETGHASAVPYESSIVILSKALSKFTSRAHKSMFGTGPEKNFFESLAPYAQLPYKVIFGNLWLFAPLVSYVIGLQPMGNSMVRTTSAVTVVRGGLKENMIPSEASALINHRIHPSQTVAEIVKYDRELISDDRVKISIMSQTEAAQASPHGDDVFGYASIKQSIQQVFTDAVVVPGMMVAATDTKWYLELTPNIYRFSPLFIPKEDVILFHGHDERIAIDNYVKAVNFYHHLILAADRSELPKPTGKTEL